MPREEGRGWEGGEQRVLGLSSTVILSFGGVLMAVYIYSYPCAKRTPMVTPMLAYSELFSHRGRQDEKIFENLE